MHNPELEKIIERVRKLQGGTWVPVGYSGLIDRCSKCGEERA